MTVSWPLGSDTCGDCGSLLDDTRVFGMCYPCAKFRSDMRKRSKAEREAVYSAMRQPTAQE